MSRSGPEPAALADAPDAGRRAAPHHTPSAARLFLGFAAIYVIWGSTYLAIRVAIETIPPFTMAGVRFLIAGALLYVWVRLRARGPAPTAVHWGRTVLIGALLFLCGNGAVVWAEVYVPSGLVALIVGMVPLWMVLVDWSMGTGHRPGPALILGLLWGLFGVGLLASAHGLSGPGSAVVPALVVMGGGVTWSFGSLWSKTIDLPRQPGLASAMEMLGGGALLLLLGAFTGELGRFDAGAVSLRSALAVAYLVSFGSLIAFSAFMWLIRVSTPALVATYAYVNPVVALFLGWAFAGEPLTPRTLLAAAVILSAVVLIGTRRVT
jgi:drug/metabolite transporter (DMT)-like permease